MSDPSVAWRAYLAGLRGAERLVPLMHPAMTPEEEAEILFDGEDEEIVEVLATGGNELASIYLTRHRQHRIEDDLGV
jgi:hypothetical protein